MRTVAVWMGLIGMLAACGSANQSNVEERTKYWEAQIAGALPPDSTKSQLEAFAKGHGQTLDCYQNHDREDQCDFDDNQSRGGAPSRPVKVAVIFVLKDDKLASYQITTVQPDPSAQ